MHVSTYRRKYTCGHLCVAKPYIYPYRFETSINTTISKKTPVPPGALPPDSPGHPPAHASHTRCLCHPQRAAAGPGPPCDQSPEPPNFWVATDFLEKSVPYFLGDNGVV